MMAAEQPGGEESDAAADESAELQDTLTDDAQAPLPADEKPSS